MRIILGTQSKNRRKVFEQFGLPFETMSAEIDEKAIRHDDPAHMTLLIARAKTQKLQSIITGSAILITADGVVILRGKVLEKPRTPHEAAEFLRSYGRSPAEVITSIVVTNTESGVSHEGTNVASITFKPIPESAVEEISNDPAAMTWAGAFSPDDPRLVPYVEKIEGGIDAILGLPRKLLTRLLSAATSQST